MPPLTRRAFGALAAGAVVAAASPLRAQPRGYAADAELLRRAYGALHPGLRRYNTPAQLDARFARLTTKLTAAPDRGHAWLALAEMTAAVRCSHTYPNPFNQTDAVTAALFGGRDRLPFHFRWMDGRMVVLRSFADDPALVPGAEISALAGVPTAEILRRLLPLSRADGAADAKRVRNMELRGEGAWEAFDLHWPLLYPQRAPEAALSLRTPNGLARRISVGLLTGAERAAAQGPALDTRGAAPVWTMARHPSGAAVLTMPTWALYNSKWDWKAWLEAALDDLGDAPALILDLRGNEGGQDVGHVILSRLVGADLRLASHQRRVRYRRTPAELNPVLDTWDRSFRDWGEQAVGPDAEGFYRLTRFDDDAEGERIRPAGRRFRGKVLVLIDSAASSATFQFAEALTDHGLGVLVGETTGGNRRGLNGGAYFFLRLPASGLEVDLPLVGYFPRTPQPDAPLQPQVRVARTAADIAAGRDPEMAAALALAAA